MNTACVIIFLNLKQKSGLSSVLVWIEGKVSLDPFFKVNNFPALPMYRFNYHSYIVDIMQQTKDFLGKRKKSKSSKPVSYKERDASMPADMVQAWIWRSNILISTFKHQWASAQSEDRLTNCIYLQRSSMTWVVPVYKLLKYLLCSLVIISWWFLVCNFETGLI